MSKYCLPGGAISRMSASATYDQLPFAPKETPKNPTGGRWASGRIPRSGGTRGISMQRQRSFAEVEYSVKKKQTRRDKFLSEMEQVVPWARLVSRLRPFYP